jgi:hypothetical protein
MPPNCVLEVDDVLQEWTWHEQFDLIHMRIMISSFEPQEWDRVYKQCYEYDLDPPLSSLISDLSHLAICAQVPGSNS